MNGSREAAAMSVEGRGASPGTIAPQDKEPRSGESIQYVFWVVGHAGAIEDFHVFLVKALAPMVPFLVRDVLDDSVDGRRTHADRAVPILPCKRGSCLANSQR